MAATGYLPYVKNANSSNNRRWRFQSVSCTTAVGLPLLHELPFHRIEEHVLHPLDAFFGLLEYLSPGAIRAVLVGPEIIRRLAVVVMNAVPGHDRPFWVRHLGEEF